jgi:hypothetical protein
LNYYFGIAIGFELDKEVGVRVSIEAVLGPTPPSPFAIDTGALSPWVKQLERETDLSPATINHRDNLPSNYNSCYCPCMAL